METTALARIRTFEVSPARFVQLALANTLLLWLIVGSGAAVRLTDSGLGCRAWPGCERGRPLPEKDIPMGHLMLGQLRGRTLPVASAKFAQVLVEGMADLVIGTA